MLRKDFPENSIGKRLDAALQVFWPQTSLRMRRRMLSQGVVLLNGREKRAGIKIKAGDWLEILQSDPQPLSKEIKELARSREYFFFYKPPYLHTVHLAGSSEQSFEQLISGNVPQGTFPEFHFLQRLDFGTSGIICAARNQAAFQSFRQAEKEGRCLKYYLALLSGELLKPCWATNALDTENRKKTRVIHNLAAPINRTFFMPLDFLSSRSLGYAGGKKEKLTLALCVIKKGQRHQIRAHASYLGFPLYGDALYGDAESNSFYLEHFRIRFPGYSFQNKPAIPFDIPKAVLLDKILQDWEHKNSL